MAVLIHIPGNWESVFILGKEPGLMCGMERKIGHFFLFLFTLGASHCLSHPELLNIQLKKSKATPGSSNHPQSQSFQHAFRCMGAPGITAGTHRSSKKPSVSEKSSQIDLWFFIILILKNFPPKKFPEQKLVIIPFFEKTARIPQSSSRTEA